MRFLLISFTQGFSLLQVSLAVITFAKRYLNHQSMKFRMFTGLCLSSQKNPILSKVNYTKIQTSSIQGIRRYFTMTVRIITLRLRKKTAASIDFTGFTTVFLFSNCQRRDYSMNWVCSLLVFEIMSKCPAYFAWRASTSALIAGSFSSRSNPRKTKNIKRLIAIGRKLENP